MVTRMAPLNEAPHATLEYRPKAAQSVVLLSPNANRKVPTFASEMNRNLMNPEMIEKFDQEYNRRFEDFALNRSSHASSMPSARAEHRNYSYAEETRLRQSMAKSMTRHMAIKGIPRFIRNTSQSASLRRTMRLVDAVQSASRLTVKTEDRWTYAAAINPNNLRGTTSVERGGFKATITAFLNQLEFKKLGKSPHDIFQFNLAQAIGRHSIGSTYSIRKKSFTPTYAYQVNKDLAYGVRNTTYLKGFQPRKYLCTVYMDYAF